MTQSDKGFAIYERVFGAREMSQVLTALSTADVERTRAGARHVLRQPTVHGLSANPRLLAIASEFVGSDPVAFRATLFDKSAMANWLVVWHQDTALPLRTRIDDPEWGPWSTKGGALYAHAPSWALERVIALRVSLDDSTSTNGPLRVLPDSHRGGVFTDEEIARLAATTTPVDCVVSSGGVVAMRPLTIHASSKSIDNRPRRVLHIEYASPVLGHGVELALC